MLLIATISLFALNVCAIVPPVPPAAVQELNRLSTLPTLISAEQLLSGVTQAELAAFQASVKTDTTNNSLPNPIATTFPNMTTGTMNGSYVVLPLDYSVARAIVPKQWGILRKSIKAVLPFWPEDKYPVILNTRIEHQILSPGQSVPDLSAAQFLFPFIDLLGDGYSTFNYVPTFFISNNLISLLGAKYYGEGGIKTTYDPPHDPYAAVPGAKDGSFYLNVYPFNSSEPAILTTTYRPQPGRFGEVGDFPMHFWTNVTEQTLFGCHDPSCILSCLNINKFYKTNITTGKNRPIGFSGTVEIAPADKSGVTWLPQGAKFHNVKGVRMDAAFVANNFKKCEDLKGHQYLGV